MKRETHVRVRALRLRNRLTREQVCSLLAMSLQEYIEIEEGHTAPDEDFISDLMNLYGVDRNEFLSKDAKISKLTVIKKDEEEDDD